MGNSASSSSNAERHQGQQAPQQFPYAPAPVYNTNGRSNPPYYQYPNNGYYGAGPSHPPTGNHYAPYGQGASSQPVNPYQHGAFPPGSPYAPPPQPKVQEAQRTATIRNQVNLKKPTLKLEKTATPEVYTLTFKFDASAPCRITTFVNATEDLRKGCKITTPTVPAPGISFGKGLEQAFPPVDHVSSSQHVLDLRQHTLSDLLTLGSTPGTQTFAILIRLEALTDEGRQSQQNLDALDVGCEQPDWVQSQTTYARLTKEEDGEIGLRIIKQKIWFKGEAYELQEIYGMERNARGGVVMGTPSTADGLEDVDGNECVICMSAPRDTAALPCRHMCMCNGCASALKTQTNKCPICRNEIEKLLHIKINKAPGPAAGTGTSSSLRPSVDVKAANGSNSEMAKGS